MIAVRLGTLRAGESFEMPLTGRMGIVLKQCRHRKTHGTIIYFENGEPKMLYAGLKVRRLEEPKFPVGREDWWTYMRGKGRAEANI